MKILFLGDIFARPGRRIVRELVPGLRDEFAIDYVIANGENAKHGKGLDLAVYDDLLSAGIDYLTSGDHIWDDREFMGPLSLDSTKVLKPANYPDTPGKGMVTVDVNGEPLTIMNLLGQVFIRHTVASPFHTFDELIKTAEGFVLVDFHAEATSEKNTFGHYIDGRAGAMIGTHTHVQTSDERLLPKGTAYISDAGMCGPMDGSIGASLAYTTPSFLHGYPFKLEPADGPIQLNGVVITVENGQATAIERVRRTIEG